MQVGAGPQHAGLFVREGPAAGSWVRRLMQAYLGQTCGVLGLQKWVEVGPQFGQKEKKGQQALGLGPTKNKIKCVNNKKQK